MIFIATDKISNYEATGRFSLGAGGGGAEVGKELWRGRSQADCYQTLLQQMVGGGSLSLKSQRCFQRRQASLFTTLAPC